MSDDRLTLLVTGRLHRATLKRVLYSHWRVDTCLTTHDGHLLAVVSAPADVPYGFGPRVQADRIRTLGTVGVLEDYEPVDVLTNVLAAMPRPA